MKNFNITKTNSLLAIAFMAFGGLFLQSCEESAIQGCTDENSLNYDSLAEEDDGSCTYDSDKFLGIFLGPLSCPNLPTLSNDSITVEITEGVYETRDSVKVTFTGGTLPPLSLAGTINGNDLTVAGTLENVPYNLGPVMTTIDVTTDANVTLSDDENTLAGNMTFVGKSSATGATVIDTDCTYSGVKQ